MERIQNPNVSSINDITTDQYTIMESKERKESQKYIHESTTRTKVSDSVQLSDTARLMLAVQQEISMIEEKENNGFSDAQQQRIEELKAQIASGEYVIDSKKIAKTILLEEDILTK